ncbi:MAG: UDP-2,3-diacylglucosamine diphosphatase LpxI [Pseudomonadota bacterium]
MRLGLIAGEGALPALIAAQQAEPPFVAALAGFPPEGLQPDLTFRLEHLGTALAQMRNAGVTRLCLIGRVRRPEVSADAIDAATAPLVPRLMAAMGQGDDGALRAIMGILEEAGFSIAGAHEIAAGLLPPAGVIAGTVSATDEADAARAAQIVAAMGRVDVGQACIVAGGQALAIEALPGTDHMLQTLAQGRAGGAALPAGGLLFKAPKPGQDLRADMPTMGPDTITLAAKAGLRGVTLAAGGVLLIERERCAGLARENGLFLWVRP